jgi:hypothetical protein
MKALSILLIFLVTLLLALGPALADDEKKR